MPQTSLSKSERKALWDEAMAIRARLKELKESGLDGRAERRRLLQRYREIDRLLQASRAQAPGATAPSAEWRVGDVILDRYEVKAELGEGGMGKVLKVHDRHWGMDLAVKNPLAASFQTETQRENFVRECHTWMDLGLHNHIVTCHYVRVLDGIPRVFADYVDGGSLKDWIDDGKLYEGGTDKALERILDIAIQFAMGLHYAHEKGIIHQDIKPANVMMTAKGAARLTDFGLANACAVIGETVALPQGGSLLASYGGMTPAYCSPEQADNAARRQAGTPVHLLPKLTRRTDLYSWAVSVLEMFTGAVTWHAGNVADQALESRLQNGPDDDDLPKMPAPLAAVLRACLQRNPDARPHDLDAVADALREVYEAVTGRAYSREAPKPAAEMADVLNNKALSFMELGRPEEALAAWDKALEQHPGHPQATYNRGLVLWRNGNETDVGLLVKLGQCEASAPDDPEASMCIGHVHMERMAFDAAAEAFRRAVARNGGDEAGRARAQAERLTEEAPRCVRTFEGHGYYCGISVCLSADGRWALSGSGDHTLRLWETATGQCVRVFKGHTASVVSVCLSSDGRWALSGSDDHTLRLWEVSSGQCVRIFKGHTSSVESVCLSVDGRWALSGSSDKTLRLWEVSSGQCVVLFEGHTEGVSSVCLSADGRWALSGSRDKTLRLWAVATGRCVRTFEGHTGSVHSVCLSGDGRWALSGSSDHRLRLWEVATGMCVRVFEGHTGFVGSVCLSADGRWALSGSWDNTVRLWEAATGRCVRTFEGHTGSVHSVCLSGDGRWALSGSSDHRLRLWDVARLTAGGLHPRAPSVFCRVVTAAEALRDSDIVKAALARASTHLAAGEGPAALAAVRSARETRLGERNREALDLWRAAGLRGRRTGLRAGWLVRTFEGHRWGVTSVCLSGDGRWALSGSQDHTLRLWDLGTGQCVRVFEGNRERVNSVFLSVDGRWALSGSDGSENTLSLWDLSARACKRVFVGHYEPVCSVCLSTDGLWALSLSTSDDGAEDKTLELWELTSGRCVRVFAESIHAKSVCLSADGRWVLSGSWSRDHTLRLWDVATGESMRDFEGHTSSVISVFLSVDGRWALSGSEDQTLRLWDVGTGQCVRVFEGHTSSVTSVCLSVDGRWALSGSEDQTLRLWDVTTGQCVRVFEGHTSPVRSVCLSADGRWALSGSDMTLRLWELDWDYEACEPSDWDEGALPYLENFLTLHTPYAAGLPAGELDEAAITRALTRQGRPAWTDGDFDQLLDTLACANYGWLRPEGVRKELEKMAIQAEEAQRQRQQLEFVDLQKLLSEQLDGEAFAEARCTAGRMLELTPDDAEAREAQAVLSEQLASIEEAECRKKEEAAAAKYEELQELLSEQLDSEAFAEARCTAGRMLERRPDDAETRQAYALIGERWARSLGLECPILPGGVVMELVPIPAGTFLMGSWKMDPGVRWDEAPEHEVTITRDFGLGKYPVTQAQYEAVMGTNPSHFKGPNRPVEQVLWDDAVVFCRRLTELERAAGRLAEAEDYRLPTEAEWEYACRAGTTTRFYWGEASDAIGEYAWWRANSGGSTQDVGQKKPNAWGLHDMCGNVREWCADWYGPYPTEPVSDPAGPFPTGPVSDPADPDSRCSRVLRGGSWGDRGDTYRFLCPPRLLDDAPEFRVARDGGFRCAERNAFFFPVYPCPLSGFRCCRTLSC